MIKTNYKKVILLGTMDTKGDEYMFLKDVIEGQGIGTVTIDVSLRGEPAFVPDYSRKDIIEYSKLSLDEYNKSDKSHTIDIITSGAKLLVEKLFNIGDIGGILSLGGSNGTYLASTIMKGLPFGLPKIIVSTVASGNTQQYIGNSDITMINSVTDIAGINRFTMEILLNSSLSLVGIIKNKDSFKFKRKFTIAATMLGVTTPCTTEAKKYLENKGYEVVVFHAMGNGGKAMEEFVLRNEFDAVLDLTTSEIINEISGAAYTAGPERLSAAVKMGIPQVVSLGGLDVLLFGSYPTVPENFRNRNIAMHNPAFSLVRTNSEENLLAGKFIAEKLNRSLPGKTTLIIPLKGLSMMDSEGKQFFGPDEDRILIDTIKKHIDKDKIELYEVNGNLNDINFARTAAELLYKKLVKAV